jgi:hypothetical protein
MWVFHQTLTYVILVPIDDSYKIVIVQLFHSEEGKAHPYHRMSASKFIFKY